MFFVTVASFALLLLWACSDGKKTPAVGQQGEPQMVLSANDTATVLQLSNDFLELVKNGQIDEAIARLYVLEGDEVQPLPEKMRENCYATLDAFEIKGYAVNSFTFNSETDTEVRYSLYLKDPATTSNPPAINGLILPVRRDGTWYITLANAEGEIQQKYRENN